MGIASAGRDLTELWFLLDAGDPDSEPLQEVCRALGPTRTVDFCDPAACLTAVREAQADAVTTFTERMCALAAMLDRRACGYAGNHVHWGRKDLQRQALRAAGVSRVRSAPVPSARALRDFAAVTGYPFVVKPVDGFASRDTWQVTGPADVEAYIAAQAAGPAGRGGAAARGGARGRGGAAAGDWPGGLYAEEFIVGRPPVAPWVADYGSADVLLGGRPDRLEDSPALIASRLPLAWPFRETGLLIPSPLPAAEQRAYAAVARRALAAVGATKGAFHVELKSALTGPEIIEINGRIGGFVARTLRLASGADIGRQALACALGHEPVLEPRWRRCVALYLHQPPARARQVAAAPSREQVSRLPGVIAVDTVAAPGTAVHWRNGTLGMVARLWVAGDDHAQLRERFIDTTEFLVDTFEYLDGDGRPVEDRTWLETVSQTVPAGSPDATDAADSADAADFPGASDSADRFGEGRAGSRTDVRTAARNRSRDQARPDGQNEETVMESER
jgi:biotin carboxylase